MWGRVLSFPDFRVSVVVGDCLELTFVSVLVSCWGLAGSHLGYRKHHKT